MQPLMKLWGEKGGGVEEEKGVRRNADLGLGGGERTRAVRRKLEVNDMLAAGAAC